MNIESINTEILNKFMTEYKKLDNEILTLTVMMGRSITIENFLSLSCIELILIILGLGMKNNTIILTAILFMILYSQYLLTIYKNSFTPLEKLYARKAVEKVLRNDLYNTEIKALDTLVDSLKKTNIEGTQLYDFLKNDDTVKINKSVFMMYFGIIIATLTSMIRTNNIDETFKDYSALLFIFIMISVILSAIYTHLFSTYIKNTRSLDLLIATLEEIKLEKIIKK